MNQRDHLQSGRPLRLAAAFLCAAAILAAAVIIANRSEQKPTAKNSPVASVEPAQRGQEVKGASVPYDAPLQALTRDGRSADWLLPLGRMIKPHFDQHDQNSSVYLEDLATGDSLRVGETSRYNIKSLMKVPLVMSLYKAHETGLLDMDKRVALTQQHLDSSFGDLYKKGAGYSLSLRQAADAALLHSDNTAIRVMNDSLFKAMPREERVYSKIKLQMQVSQDGDTHMSTQSYAAIFRCLHEACYNSRADSDTILTLLKRTDFHAPERLLPAGTPVAHKIGAFNKEGFRDCGIVYGPKRQFLFCIMLSKGDEHARHDIGEIVRQAYDHFQK